MVWGDATVEPSRQPDVSTFGDNWDNTHSTVIPGSRSVAMTGPVDAYNFAGLAKESAVPAVGIVDVKIGPTVNFKVALGSIDFEFHSLWTLKKFSN